MKPIAFEFKQVSRDGGNFNVDRIVASGNWL